jgi:F-type H+-transporting ATPase subunit a
MLPINLISEIAVPISLSFRLFGNMFGGLVIMSMIYKMLPLFIRFWFPGILHIYFDVFTGFLQAFIFITLSITFIKNKKF